MQGFKQYIEALASHGGYWFQRGQESLGRTATGKDVKFSFPDYADWGDGRKTVKTSGDLEAEKTHKVLTRNYKDVIGKLDERLMKLGGVNFHIYFGLPENIKDLIDYDFDDDRKRTEEVLERYFFDEMKIPKSDIVFVKTGPSGDLLTPWMILHSVGHGITDSKKNSVRIFEDKWNHIFWNRLGDVFNVTKPEVMACLFNFRSARIANDYTRKTFTPVRDAVELRNELFASYLWNGGHIRRPTPECMEKLAKMPNPKSTIDWDEMNEFQIGQHLTKMIKKFYNDCDMLFKEVLDSFKGHVITDIFPYVDKLKTLEP